MQRITSIVLTSSLLLGCVLARPQNINGQNDILQSGYNPYLGTSPYGASMPYYGAPSPMGSNALTSVPAMLPAYPDMYGGGNVYPQTGGCGGTEVPTPCGGYSRLSAVQSGFGGQSLSTGVLGSMATPMADYYGSGLSQAYGLGNTIQSGGLAGYYPLAGYGGLTATQSRTPFIGSQSLSTGFPYKKK